MDRLVPYLLDVWHWVSAGAISGGLLEVLKALAAPIIAVAAVRVSRQQVRINESKLRLDMYEKRLRIYKAVRELCGCVVYSASVSPTDLAKYREETMETDFLFDDPAVPRYVREVGSKVRQLIQTEQKFDRAHKRKSDEEHALYDRLTDLQEWVSDQLTESSEVFRPFLAPEQRAQRFQK
ncbi:hypothetical protein ACUDTL_16950 [Stenotrophomonas pavanii]|uniref:hypothetical protein n=1 Tax=Stenotrophomonas pavanii TaxID=487698 RepID=UPI004042227B